MGKAGKRDIPSTRTGRVGQLGKICQAGRGYDGIRDSSPLAPNMGGTQAVRERKKNTADNSRHILSKRRKTNTDRPASDTKNESDSQMDPFGSELQAITLGKPAPNDAG